MKKILAMIMALAMVFALCACVVRSSRCHRYRGSRRKHPLRQTRLPATLSTAR